MTLNQKLGSYNLILGSKSPRRQYLLKELGLDFESKVIEVDEDYSDELATEDIAPFLAELKGEAHVNHLDIGDIVITADTIVALLDGEILHKPKDSADAFRMLRKLSGKTHLVYTGVCLTSKMKQSVFCEATEVSFHELTDEEIEVYIETCKPFDKAGSYGIQEWMGYAGIRKINGDFFGVMGLPLQLLYRKLNEFID